MTGAGEGDVVGHVLVVNAGSSSLKYQVLDASTGHRAATGIVSEIGGDARLVHDAGGTRVERDTPCPSHAEAFRLAREALRDHGPSLEAGGLLAVGHRVVHGGARLTEPVVVDDEVLGGPPRPLAPGTAAQPGERRGDPARPGGVPGRTPRRRVRHRLPPHPPAAAHTYAVPRAWREHTSVRRYGFHGSSHAFVSRRIPTLLDRAPADLRLVVLHLGNGASACAVTGGRSVDTSMGLSPARGARHGHPFG